MRRPYGDPLVTVAIVDGSADLRHPAFAESTVRVLPRPGVPHASERATDHATHLASIVFGRLAPLFCGLAPRCSGVVIPVFSRDAGGRTNPCSQEDLAAAILAALAAGADVVNVSAGELDAAAVPAAALCEALEACTAAGAVVVAAAGNDGCACPHVPAAWPGVLVVGAANDAGDPLPLSNWGPAYSGHGVVAPGDRIFGAAANGGWSRQTGTSVATAIVSGVLALLISESLARYGRRDGAENAARLLAAANRARCAGTLCDRLLRGRLDPERAVAALLRPHPGPG
ncbi:MAG TPA: S8 family serine peptidase [Candidatus Elarobacter sp.]|nr:S8 family serine peptidase [Dongiaceae bacterium]HZW53810.1 S8 family serine peptidase [Candidatus Elarobacter sp.]